MRADFEGKARKAGELREAILAMCAEYFREAFGRDGFVPGETFVKYAGRFFDERECVALVDSALDLWLTLGEKGREFEARLAEYVGVKCAAMVNSGSSANLLAFSALMSPKLGDPIRPGDEVITPACGFPSTVNPVIQCGCIPVFVDVRADTANIDVPLLEDAMSPRVRAVMAAHTLGNPFDAAAVLGFCERHGLYLIEDNCDALGSRFGGKRTGSFGHLATQSFYPPHHITTGEGGAVLTDDPKLFCIVRSLRDWGRDCRCDSGVDNTCKRRFSQKFSSLPFGYDHKYVYSHLGYNLKPLELQAALGLEQLRKLPGFVRRRQENYHAIRDAVEKVGWLDLQRAEAGSEPSWFAALLVLKEDAPVERADVIRHLEEDKRIQTRLLFGGNLTRQPAYSAVKFRIAGDLGNTDRLMRRGFFIGVHPGLGGREIEYVREALIGLGNL